MRPRHRNSEVLLAWVPVQGATVVDVGCGDGALARTLVQAGAARVVGLEVSARQLARAARTPLPPEVMILKGGAQALPLADASADAVIFFNSLHHVPKALMPQALAEAARVVRSGGWIYVGEPIAEGPHFDLLRPVDDETEVRAAALACVRQAVADGLSLEREQEYLHTVRLASFEALRERTAAANPEREAVFDAHETSLRAAFDRLGRRDADGATLFDQPMRALLLRKP
ncbi:class I SAM-dependent methyltransferase [Pararhodospirillum photometricum]|nr:class I SAM-dependent methyltransferase [Pararhodospirillum photometricum]